MKRRRTVSPLKASIVRFFTNRLWWLDVLYPILLALTLISLLTYVIYSGQKHMRLASLGENGLMRTSLLMFNTSRIDKPTTSVVVSLEESDLADVSLAQGTDVRDSSIEGYAKVLRRIAFASPKVLVLSWTPAAHVGAEADYTPLVQAFRQVPPGVKVLFAYPPTEKWALPVALQKISTFVGDVPCDDFSEVQLACPLNPDNRAFDDWVIQNLLTQTISNFQTLRANGKVSEDIARTHPSFLVNVPPVSILESFSFRDILSDNADLSRFKGKVVLVGSNLIQPSTIRSNAAVRRVYTNQSHVRESLRTDGTPLHVFWAQLTELFAQDNLVRIPSAGQQLSITILFCLCILTIIYRMGDVAAIGTFLGFVTLAPAVNALSIKLFQSYIPLFDLYYFGLGTLIVAGFGRLSLEAFDRWRIDERQRYHSHTADLKGNFTSLVSHNLNTPIAKLQGILELLKRLPQAGPWGQNISKAISLGALLQLYVKCVLVSTAIDEKSLNFVACTAVRLRDEFMGNFSALLSKLGIQINFANFNSSEDEIELVPVRLDVRALTTTLAAILTLAKENNHDALSRVTLKFTGNFDEDGHASLLLLIQWQQTKENETLGIAHAIDFLTTSESIPTIPAAPSPRPLQILEHLIIRGLEIHQTKVEKAVSQASTDEHEILRQMLIRVWGAR